MILVDQSTAREMNNDPPPQMEKHLICDACPRSAMFGTERAGKGVLHVAYLTCNKILTKMVPDGYCAR